MTERRGVRFSPGLSVVVLLGVVTVLASLVPARRAAAMNPVELLKTD
jgi:ABC-type lipoprotein release transport system permease subunit